MRSFIHLRKNRKDENSGGVSTPPVPDASDPEVFSTEHLQQGLGQRSVEGLAMGVGSQGIQFLLTITGTIVLARLLDPEDFGLVAMAAVISALVIVIGDFGLSAAIIQRAKITQRQVSTIFWVNIGIGLTMALTLAAISPLVSLLYGESRLTGITIAHGVLLFIASAGSQHSAILRRQMRFRLVATITVTSAGLGLTAGITAALLGAGYWSLLVMPFTAGIASLILKMLIVRWIPGRPGWDSAVRELIGFGANVTGSNFIQIISRQLDNFLIGRFVGAASLGFYTKAYSLMIMPPRQVINPVRLVFTPGLSSLVSKPAAYRRHYSLMVLGTATLIVPGVFFFMVMAEPLVDVLLGEQWQPTARLFQYLAPAALFSAPGMLGAVYRSWGHVRREFRWELIAVPVTVTGFIIGIFFGMEGVAIGFSVTRALLLYPALKYCYSTTPITVNDFHRAIWRPLVAAIAGSSAVLLMLVTTDFSSSVLSLAIAVPIFGAIYCGAWLLLPGGMALFSEGMELLKQFKDRPSQQVTA